MFDLPRWCFQCREFISVKKESASTYLCRNCRKKLPLIEKSACLKCGAEHLSENCREQWPRHISSFRAVCAHQPPIDQWIASFKYRRDFIAGRILRNILAEWFSSNRAYLSDVDFIVPSPIHPLRLRRRGFNQTEFLVKGQKQPPVEHSLIKKSRHTPYQASLSRSERLRNLKGAFKSACSPMGKKILLFDDVCASGGTMEEISGCLKQAGAESVKVLVLSRAV